MRITLSSIASHLLVVPVAVGVVFMLECLLAAKGSSKFSWLKLSLLYVPEAVTPCTQTKSGHKTQPDN
jgi:hypothetical protein